MKSFKLFSFIFMALLWCVPPPSVHADLVLADQLSTDDGTIIWGRSIYAHNSVQQSDTGFNASQLDSLTSSGRGFLGDFSVWGGAFAKVNSPTDTTNFSLTGVEFNLWDRVAGTGTPESTVGSHRLNHFFQFNNGFDGLSYDPTGQITENFNADIGDGNGLQDYYGLAGRWHGNFQDAGVNFLTEDGQKYHDSWTYRFADANNGNKAYAFILIDGVATGNNSGNNGYWFDPLDSSNVLGGGSNFWWGDHDFDTQQHISLTAVPEPSGMLMFGIVAIGMTIRRRKLA